MKDKRTHDLLLLSAKVCRHCTKFKTKNCSKAPADPRGFIWSSLSTCAEWSPVPVADEALQILTWRKLQGQNIEFEKKEEAPDYDVYDDDPYY